MGNDLVFWGGAAVGFLIVGGHVSNFINGVIGKVGSLAGGGAQSAATIAETRRSYEPLVYYDDSAVHSHFTDTGHGRDERHGFSLPWGGPLDERFGIDG